MGVDIILIKRITSTEIIATDMYGKAVVLSTRDLTELHKLDIGGENGRSAYVTDNFLIVASLDNVHIFNRTEKYQKLAQHNIG